MKTIIFLVLIGLVSPVWAHLGTPPWCCDTSDCFYQGVILQARGETHVTVQILGRLYRVPNRAAFKQTPHLESPPPKDWGVVCLKSHDDLGFPCKLEKLREACIRCVAYLELLF